MPQAILQRGIPDTKETLGVLQGTNNQNSFQCDTIENNAVIIPAGYYVCVLMDSPRLKRKTYHVTIPNNDNWNNKMIEIHNMNFYFQSEGCIGVGDKEADINGDGELDVLDSNSTLDKMILIMGTSFTFTIKDYIATA